MFGYIKNYRSVDVICYPYRWEADKGYLCVHEMTAAERAFSGECLVGLDTSPQPPHFLSLASSRLGYVWPLLELTV